jgi:hypothetical protein
MRVAEIGAGSYAIKSGVGRGNFGCVRHPKSQKPHVSLLIMHQVRRD